MNVNTGLPKSFWSESEGVVYFTLPSGGDATLTGINIYTPKTVVGLVTDICDYFSARGNLEVTGVDIRYGNVQTSGFRTSLKNDVHVMGAAVNCFDNGNWTKDVWCEASGAGSNGSSTTSDGFNTHAWSTYIHEHVWTHDNVDDGESSHENCNVFGISSLSEWNGGSGFTPAIGCQGYYLDCMTRSNALRTRLPTGKLGGFEANGNPSNTTSAARRTLVKAVKCTSENDYNGYSSQGYTGDPNQPYLIAENCVARNSMFYGFNCAQAVNCSYSGTGTPYNSARCSLTKDTPLS